MFCRGCRHAGFQRRLSFIFFSDAATGVVLECRGTCHRVRSRAEDASPGERPAGADRGLRAPRRCSSSCPATCEKLHVDIGDRVEADQLLVDLFLPESKDELRQKEAALAQAQAEIELATAAVRAAEAAVATARREHQRRGSGQHPRRGRRDPLAIAICADRPARLRRLVGSQARRRDAATRSRRPKRPVERPSQKSKRPRPACCKARPISARPRPTSRSPAPARETRRPISRASRPCCNTRRFAPLCRDRHRTERQPRRFRATARRRDGQASVDRR